MSVSQVRMKRVCAPPPPIPPQHYIFPPAKDGCYYGDISLYQQEIEDPNEPSATQKRINEHVAKLSQPTSRQIEAFSETRLRLEESQRSVVVPDAMRRFNNKNKNHKRLFSVFPASTGCDDPNMERTAQRTKHTLPPLRVQTSRSSGPRHFNGKLGNMYEWQPCPYEPVHGHLYRGTRTNIHLTSTYNGLPTTRGTGDASTQKISAAPWRLGASNTTDLLDRNMPGARTFSHFPDHKLQKIRDTTRARHVSPFRVGCAPLTSRDISTMGQTIPGVEFPNPYRPSEEIHVETTCLDSGVSGHRYKDTSVSNNNYNSKYSGKNKTIPVSQCYEALSERFGSQDDATRVLKEGKRLHTYPWRVTGPAAPLVHSEESKGELECVWSDTRTCEHQTQATKVATGRL